MKTIWTALAATLLASMTATAAEKPRNYDVVVYSATPGGIAAAVNAGREGMTVALVQPDGHVGGLASGGLSNTDLRSFESIGGTFREFIQRVRDHYADTYGSDSQEVVDCVLGGYYEPHVARSAFEAMLDDAGVDVFLHHVLLDAERTDDKRPRLTGIRCSTPDADESVRFQAKVFVDGSYEGDLIAAAGAEYRLGCESKDEYGESLAFDEPNNYVQTYNFRVCLTRDPENRLPIPKPENYDRQQFAPLLDFLEKGVVQSLTQLGPKPVLKVRPMANQKADFNDVAQSPISLSIKNVNHPWPEGDQTVRQGIYDYYKNYSLGLFWFLTHDEEVPADWREEMAEWGLPKDEFPDNDHWTPALYVREGRRLVGEYVFTEHDTQPKGDEVRAKLNPDSVAIGDYSLNCHGVYSEGIGKPNVGHFGKRVKPYQIPYGTLIPRDVDGLLSPVPMSASHVGFGALRMEPSWTALGQAAGLAAAQAIAGEKDVRDVDVTTLQLRLHEVGALTVYAPDLGETIDVPRPAWDRPGTSFQVTLQPLPPVGKLFRAVQFFGTKGFFHGMLTADDVKERQQRTTGQWSSEFPGHRVYPDKPLDAELARRWLRMAKGLGIEPPLGADQAVEKKLTRGEMLAALFDAFIAGRKD